MKNNANSDRRTYDEQALIKAGEEFMKSHPIDWLLDDNASEEEKAYRKRLNENGPILHKKIEEAIASIGKS